MLKKTSTCLPRVWRQKLYINFYEKVLRTFRTRTDLQKPSISGQILKWLSVLGERDAGITAQSKERLARMNAEKHRWGKRTQVTFKERQGQKRKKMTLSEQDVEILERLY